MKFIKNLYNKWLLLSVKRDLPVQDVFNIAIDSGVYSEETDTFMCVSLRDCYCYDLITRKELDKSLQEIREYLQDIYTLKNALIQNGLSWSFEHRLAIYRDWANRPVLSK